MRLNRLTRRPRRSLLVCSASVLIALVAATPASAVWNAAGSASGYVGPWVGSYGSVSCVQHSKLVWHAGPWVGRIRAYPRAVQTIAMQPRLERLIAGRYVIEQRGQWRSMRTNPGQHANFQRAYFVIPGDGVVHVPVNVPDGVFRVSYLFRWYVGGHQVGSIVKRHHDNEIEISVLEGQRIVSNGCTMDV
jgi:hypothetical protein